MAQQEHGALASRQSDYEWDSRFYEQRPDGYMPENIPLCSRDGPLPENAAEIIEIFLDVFREDANLYQYQAAVIVSFSMAGGDPVDFPTLKEGIDPRVKKPIALLDDRNEEGKSRNSKGTCRSRKGALSAHQLLQELSKRRYKSPPGVVQHPRVPGIEVNEPDADRRLIYVTDLDRWALLAIMATASSSQAAYLRAFIYKYLEFETYIGVRCMTMGFPSFALEIHIPLYAWRPDVVPFEDQRRKSDGHPLRRSRNLDFLDMCSPEEINNTTADDCIYEVQISCMVSGLSNWSWVAYAMVDTYYQGPDNRESVEHFAQPAIRIPDPLTRGVRDADQPVWKPREYFLWVFEAQINQVRRESHNLVGRLLQKIQPYTHDYLHHSPNGVRQQSSTDDNLYDKPIRLLQQISNQLCRTIDALANFMRTDRNYFLVLDEPVNAPSAFKLLFSIEQHASELRELQKKVEDQKSLLERLSHELEIHLQLDTMRVASQQQQTSEHVKALTIVALLFIPLSTTAAIFSIPSDTFPFERSLRVFCVMTAILITVLLVILSFTFRFYWYRGVWDQLCHWARRGIRVVCSAFTSSAWSLFSTSRRRHDDLEEGRIRLGSDDGFELLSDTVSRRQGETDSRLASSSSLVE